MVPTAPSFIFLFYFKKRDESQVSDTFKSGTNKKVLPKIV
jgi:hypothetical protein